MGKIRILAMAFSGCLLITGAGWSLQIYQGYRKGRTEYQELADAFTSGSEIKSGYFGKSSSDRGRGYVQSHGDQTRVVEDMLLETESEAEPKEGTAEGSWGKLPADAPERISVKWAELLEKNSDVAGWILLPAVDLSYPVMQAEDNEKYLHRSISGEYLYAGSIFLDCKCSRSFRAYNTILYGHNMRDGSMFAKLKDYKNPEIYNACPYFWIFTPEKDLLYRVCSVHPAGIGGSSYIIRFGSGKELSSWRETVKEQSEIETGWEPVPEDRVVTLSTCTEDHGTRYTVQGVLIFVEEKQLAKEDSDRPEVHVE